MKFLVFPRSLCSLTGSQLGNFGGRLPHRQTLRVPQQSWGIPVYLVAPIKLFGLWLADEFLKKRYHFAKSSSKVIFLGIEVIVKPMERGRLARNFLKKAGEAPALHSKFGGFAITSIDCPILYAATISLRDMQ